MNVSAIKLTRSESAIFISITLFILALIQTCYCTDRDCVSSAYVFIVGPIAMLTGGAALTWLANPILLISWIKYRSKSKTSLYCSIIATLISLSFLIFNEIIADEAGNFRQIISYRLGYWLWLASCLVMVIGNLFKEGEMNNA